jgi:hypothetical protein
VWEVRDEDVKKVPNKSFDKWHETVKETNNQRQINYNRGYCQLTRGCRWGSLD